jgi:hypothetical protein
MKAPWRYLADLVSKKSSANQPIDLSAKRAGQIDGEPTEQIEEVALESKLIVDTVADVGLEPERRDDIETDDKGGTADFLLAGAEEEAVAGFRHVAGVERTPPTPTVAATSESAVAMRGTSPIVESIPKPTRQSKKARPQVVSAGQPIVEIAPSARLKTYLEEMTELDAQVRELRMQLTEKLARQNQQLHQMLKRFQ